MNPDDGIPGQVPGETPERECCPACGGSGGGPFGRMSAGWDIETYECPKCEGWGYIRAKREADRDEDEIPPAAMPKPGIAKTVPGAVVDEKAKRRASS